MRKPGSFFTCSLLLMIFLSSCLTVETKEYTFELTGENSGRLTIKYINIMSVNNDSLPATSDDFNELITGYLEGTQFETEFPETVISGKKIFEENGMLCGEVTVDFKDLNSVKLFQYDKKSPLMLYLSGGMTPEVYDTTNGRYGGDIMPVVFWPNNMKKLTLTTTFTVPDETTVSLLEEYRKWKR